MYVTNICLRTKIINTRNIIYHILNDMKLKCIHWKQLFIIKHKINNY